MMVAINKNSQVIKDNTDRLFFNDCVLNVSEGEHLLFSKAAIRLCNLKVHNYIHFLNDGKLWQFYTNEDKDGFKLCKSKLNLCIASKPLSRLILKTTGYNKNKVFKVEETNILHNGFRVYELS